MTSCSASGVLAHPVLDEHALAWWNARPDRAAAARRGRDHMDVLRYAAGICAAGYEPATVEKGLLEQFAAGETS